MSFSSTERRAVGALATALAFRMFGVFLATPIIALAARAMTPDPALVGLAVGAYGLTQGAMQAPTGWLSDKWGRKPALLLGLTIFTIGGFVAAAADSIWQLIGGRFLQGGGAIAAVVAAWVADVTSSENRAKGMAVVGAVIVASFFLSLPAGTALFGAVGASGVFIVSAGLGVAAIIAVSTRPPPRPHPPADGESAPAASASPWRDPALLRLSFGAFASHFCFASLFTHLPIALAENMPPASQWKIYAPALLALLVVGAPMIAKSDRGRGARSATVTVAASVLLAIGVMAAFALARDPLGAAIGVAFFFCGFGVLEAVFPAMASRQAAAHQRGQALGVLMTLEFFGIFCGGALTGLCLQFGGEAAAMGLLAVIIAAWAALLSVHIRSEKTIKWQEKAASTK